MHGYRVTDWCLVIASINILYSKIEKTLHCVTLVTHMSQDRDEVTIPPKMSVERYMTDDSISLFQTHFSRAMDVVSHKLRSHVVDILVRFHLEVVHVKLK